MNTRAQEQLPSRADAAGREPVHLALDEASVALRLAEFGLDRGAASTVSAFAGVYAGEALGLALLERLGEGDGWGFSDNLEAIAAYRYFRNLFLAFFDYPFDPAWLAELVSAWVELYRRGGEAALPAWVSQQVLDTCLEALLEDAASGSRLTTEMAAVLGKAMLFLAGVMSDASASYDQARQQRCESVDEMSGLPNARHARKVLASHIVQAAAGQSPPFVGVVVFSVELAPAMLRRERDLPATVARQIAERMSQALRVTDTLCVLDERHMAAILPALRTPAQITLALTRVVQQFDKPFLVSGRECRVVPTAGAACYPDSASDAVSLLQAARLALYEARHEKKPFEIFHERMDESAAASAELEHLCLDALREGRLELFLQPQYDVHTGLCLSAEALLRLRRPDGRMIPPNLIMDAIERAGATGPFTRWLINRGVRMLAELGQKGIDASISINCTAEDVSDPDLPELIAQSLATWKVPPERLLVELTEGAMIQDENRVLEILERIAATGVRLAVDDFGTGYSSMAYLRRLPLHELKIDQVFVRKMTQSSQDQEIVRSMIQLAHSLGLEVVAEGAEDDATRALLASFGCERIQGYGYSRPISLGDFMDWYGHTGGVPVHQFTG